MLATITPARAQETNTDHPDDRHCNTARKGLRQVVGNAGATYIGCAPHPSHPQPRTKAQISNQQAVECVDDGSPEYQKAVARGQKMRANGESLLQYRLLVRAVLGT